MRLWRDTGEAMTEATRGDPWPRYWPTILTPKIVGGGGR